MHFAAFLDVGESVREPARYYRNNVDGALSVLEAMAAESVARTSSSRRPARPTASRSRRRSPRRIRSSPINSYGEIEAGGRAGAAALRARATACGGWRCATSTRPAPIRTARSARITRRRFTSSRARSRRRPAGPACRCSATTTRRRTAPACATTCTSPIWPTRTSGRSRRSSRRGRSGVYNLGTGRPHSVREVIDAVERVTGRHRAVDAGAAARRAIRRCCTRPPQKAQAELRWTPRFADLETIVRTAWDWHRTHPHGYGGRRRVRDDASTAAAACSRTRGRIAAALALGGRSAWCVYAVGIGRAGRAHQADPRQRAARISEQRRARSPGRSSASTSSRASARTSRRT